MGLAVANIQFLALTARKSELEFGMTMIAMDKMSLAREQQDLSREYNSRLNAKNVCYYANGKYNKINYNYLMGYGSQYSTILNNSKPLKENNNMILADYRGATVLSDTYANAIKAVCGSSIMNNLGRGGTFSQEKIADILHELIPEYTADEFRNGVDALGYSSTLHNVFNGDATGTTMGDSACCVNENLKRIIDFYYPIFQSAAANGWTTEYNNEIVNNPDYVSDALNSGTMQLFGVNDYGQYDEGSSLNYFVTAGELEQKSDADQRSQIEAWYQEQRDIISYKESGLDLEMQDMSAELESVKTEMESIDSFIKNAIETVFKWGS